MKDVDIYIYIFLIMKDVDIRWAIYYYLYNWDIILIDDNRVIIYYKFFSTYVLNIFYLITFFFYLCS